MVYNQQQVSTPRQKYCAPILSTYSFYGEAGYFLSGEGDGLPGEEPTTNDFGDF